MTDVPNTSTVSYNNFLPCFASYDSVSNDSYDFFLSLGIQEKLGILNNGIVYAVYDYMAHNNDELSFKEGDRLIILRKGDEMEREWWWSRLQDKEGYVPRNLLGVNVYFFFY